MNILDEIIAAKRKEVKVRRAQLSIDKLTKMPLFEKKSLSFSESIKNGCGIIAEYKRCSPSAGKIQNRSIEEVLRFYNEHELSGYSILTDDTYFGG